MDLLKVIEESLQEQLSNGAIKEIAGKVIREAIEDSIKKTLRYNGEARNYLEQEITKVMVGAIKESDFGNYTQIIKSVINTALPETALPEYKEFVAGLQKTLGKTGGEKFGAIKLDEVLDKYVEYIEKQTFNADDFDNVDDGTAYVTCSVEVEELEGDYSWETTTQLIFKTNVDNDDHEVSVEIKYNRIEMKFDSIQTYHTLNDFELYLLMLSNNYTRIEINKDSIEKDVCVEVEY